MPTDCRTSILPQRARAQRGMSLLEVLVALVVLSFGVLAVVALQLVAKRNNADAGQRLVAAQLAYDMLERMRANSHPTALQVYSGMLGAGFLGRNQVNSAAITMCTQASPCDASNLAVFDLRTWEDQLDGAAERIGSSNTGGLALATACIAPVAPTVAGDAGIYSVTIAFKGTTPIPIPDAEEASVPSCGLNAADGGVNLYGPDNEYRRVIQVLGYIQPI